MTGVRMTVFRFVKSYRLFVVVGAILLLVVCAQSITSRPGPGLHDGRLAACPDSPNCVCSQDAEAAHAIAPLAFRGSAADAMRALKQVLAGQPLVRVITEAPNYLHAEFRTPLCRFVDDVEFLVVEKAHVIHVRSASRVGYSDLGTNRRRVEALRREFAAVAAPGLNAAGSNAR